MGELDEYASLVALTRLSRRPAHHISELLQSAGSARVGLEKELDAGAAQGMLFEDTLGHVGPSECGAGDSSEVLRAAAARDVERWQRRGFRLLSVLDHDYPANLRAVYDRPPLLFVAGGLRCADARGVAVIGSRRPSADGFARAGVISTHLQAKEYVVISGLAEGIDTAAHTAALRAGGRTLAVIGTGLEHPYPPQNAGLQAAIASGGAVISHLRPEQTASRRTFPARNALMSGLAMASVIVEAGPGSGTRIQARAALAHNRPVFIWKALLSLGWVRELSERPGVHTFDSPDEITDRLEHLYADASLVDEPAGDADRR